MIDYTIGDKVVCIDDTTFNVLDMLKHRVQNIEVAVTGQIYTVRDMGPPEDFIFGDPDSPGVLLKEISAGVDSDGDEWWFEAICFRKALPADIAQSTQRQHQPA